MNEVEYDALRLGRERNSHITLDPSSPLKSPTPWKSLMEPSKSASEPGKSVDLIASPTSPFKAHGHTKKVLLPNLKMIKKLLFFSIVSEQNDLSICLTLVLFDGNCVDMLRELDATYITVLKQLAFSTQSEGYQAFVKYV